MKTLPQHFNVLCKIYYRGVILYAMVCGRLPFGDDSQVKAQQKQGLSFPTSRLLSSDSKELIRSILNSKVKERFDTYDMILHDWTASLPVRVPPPLSSKPKYTLEGCIPTVRETSLTGRPPTPIPLPVEPGPLLAPQYVHQTSRTHHQSRNTVIGRNPAVKNSSGNSSTLRHS